MSLGKMVQASDRPVKPRAMRVCLFLVRLLLLSVGWLVLLIGVGWAFGALWFDFPVATLRRPLAVAFGLSAIAALVFVRPHWRAQLGVAGAIVLLAACWLTIRPSNTRDWQPEVTEAPYAEIEGDRVVIHSFRNFDYISKTDFRPRWETKTVHLSNLRAVDFFTNYWGSTLICHTFVSFDFAPEGYVCISIETRMSNCTSNIRLHIKHIGSARPWDWQLLANGSIDEHAYELGAIDTSLPFAELKRLSHINDRARADRPRSGLLEPHPGWTAGHAEARP
jgi:hypothetical protein